MTMKAHTYYIIFERPPIGGELPASPLAAPLLTPHISVHSAAISEVLTLARDTT